MESGPSLNEAPALPSKEEFASGVLCTDRPMVFWEADKKTLLAKAVHEYAQSAGRKLNDILDHYGIDRAVYYLRVDPYLSAQPQEEPEQRRGRRKGDTNKHTLLSLREMSLLERIALIDSIRTDYSAANIVDACKRAGIDRRAYRYLELNEAAWKKEIKAEAERLELERIEATKQRKLRRKHLSDQRQRVLVDAIDLLHDGVGLSYSEASEHFDRTHQSYPQWKKKHGITSLLRNGDSKKERRSPEEKVRIVYAVRAINSAVKRHMRQALSGVDVSYAAFTLWRNKTSTIEQYLSKFDEIDVPLESHRDLAAAVLQRKTRLRPEKFQGWLRQMELLNGNEATRERIRLLLENPLQTPSPVGESNGNGHANGHRSVRSLPAGYEERETVQLVQLARGGDTHAMGALWMRYEGMLRKAIFQKLGDMHETEDVLQQTYLQVCDKIGDLRSENSVGQWMKVAARRRAINHITRVRKENSVGEFFQQDPAQKTPVEILMTEEDDEQRRRKNGRVHEAIQGLGRLDSQALQLFYFDELSLEEIAALTGAPVGTIKRRLHVARKRLAGILLQRGIAIKTDPDDSEK